MGYRLSDLQIDSRLILEGVYASTVIDILTPKKTITGHVDITQVLGAAIYGGAAGKPTRKVWGVNSRNTSQHGTSNVSPMERKIRTQDI